MPRSKTASELRKEIMAWEQRRSKPQDVISESLKLNQATLSRILRGKFRRRSGAVVKICKYAKISCITERPPGALEASLDSLTLLANGGSTKERQAMKLIRLAAELLEATPSPPPRRQAGGS